MERQETVDRNRSRLTRWGSALKKLGHADISNETSGATGHPIGDVAGVESNPGIRAPRPPDAAIGLPATERTPAPRQSLPAQEHSPIPEPASATPVLSASTSQDDTPSTDDIRNALVAVLQSEVFAPVGQLRAFLAYVVRAVLENREQELKGYTIAVEALGRDESFDPNTNPIVRVEAARLRRRLALYYDDQGADDPVRILIPKGSYVPVFRFSEEGHRDGAPTRRPSAMTWSGLMPGGALTAPLPASIPGDVRSLSASRALSALSGLAELAAQGATAYAPALPRQSARPVATVSCLGARVYSETSLMLAILGCLVALCLAFFAGYLAGQI